MTPSQHASLDSIAGRTLTAEEIALAESRDDTGLAAALSAGRTQRVPTLLGFGQVMSALGPIDGAALLDTLDAVRASNRPLWWAWSLLEKGTLDVGNLATQAQITALATAGLMTPAQASALIGLAHQPAPITADAVSNILNGA